MEKNKLIDLDLSGIIPDRDDFPSINYPRIDHWSKENNIILSQYTPNEIKLVDLYLAGNNTPIVYNSKNYDCGKMIDYCKNNGKEVKDLTNDELEMFITDCATGEDLKVSDKK